MLRINSGQSILLQLVKTEGQLCISIEPAPSNPKGCYYYRKIINGEPEPRRGDI